MAAMDNVELVDDFLDDFDIDVVIQALDMDLSAHGQFRGGAGCSAIFSDADIVSHCRHGCNSDGGGGAAPAGSGWLLAGLMGDDDDDNCGDKAEEEEEEESRSSSPADSSVTDDGALAPAVGDDGDAEAMSAYVAELERFLLENDDDGDGSPCGEHADGLLGVVDDYFAGDQLLATTEVVPAAGRAGRGRTYGEDEEENGDGGGDILAAREDEQSASRKRARNKIKGTAMLTPWGELEAMNLTMMHLARIQVPAAPCRGHQLRMWSSGLIHCSKTAFKTSPRR